MLPVSIVIAAVLIAGAIFYKAGTPVSETPKTARDIFLNPVAVTVPPITEADHVRGSRDASLKIIEYSDLECPYCQDFHGTMQQVMSVYGDKVAWVYRDFPLVEIHPKAVPLAEAAECIAAQSGNDAYWNFLDRIFAIPSISDFSLEPAPAGTASLISVATALDVDTEKLQACRDARTYQAQVESERADGIAAGAEGTPYAIVISPKGNTYVIPGALPFDTSDPDSVSVREILEAALKN